MSDDRPTNAEGVKAVGDLLQNCGCLIMCIVGLVILVGFLWAVLF